MMDKEERSCIGMVEFISSLNRTPRMQETPEYKAFLNRVYGKRIQEKSKVWLTSVQSGLTQEEFLHSENVEYWKDVVNWPEYKMLYRLMDDVAKLLYKEETNWENTCQSRQAESRKAPSITVGTNDTMKGGPKIMANTKYTLIGMSSAGKTCYITAMYKEMAVGFDGFTLVTDDQTRANMEKVISILDDRQAGQDRFPQATPFTDSKRYGFRMCYETKEIISFEMMDYAGGALNTPGNDAHAQVKQSIGESTALYMFIDGALFCQNSREDREDGICKCALTLTPIIQDYADTHKGIIPPIVMVVTKADLCKKYVTNDEVIRTIRRYFHPAFSEGIYSYICAVSLGKDISDDGYKGKFDPVNIHIPFFIGSYHACYDQCKKLKEEVAEKEEVLLQIEENIKTGRRKIVRQLEPQRIELSSKLNEMRENLECKEALFSRLGTRLEVDSAFFECFINGMQQEKFRQLKL